MSFWHLLGYRISEFSKCGFRLGLLDHYSSGWVAGIIIGFILYAGSCTGFVPIEDDIKGTLDRSEAIRDASIRNGEYGPITSEHFHSYEYLVSLIAERQKESDKKLDRLTVIIAIMTFLTLAITAFLGYDVYQNREHRHSAEQQHGAKS